jgi:iron complex transport system permease protein
MLFSMIPITVIVIMAPFFRKSPASLILSGVAVSYLFNSLTSLLMVSTDSANLSLVYHWQVGTLSRTSWEMLPLSTAMTLIGLAILLPLAGKLNIMALDDKDAKSLGLDIEKLRILCLVVLALMTSVIISYVGIIGFVGLVIPHIVRIVLGADNKYLLPAAGAFGAVFLLGCDIISRAMDVGATIPVGVITSFIGAPIFLYLIIRQKKNIW